MDQRDLIGNGSPARRKGGRRSREPARLAALNAARAQALTECTRALLRARHEHELAPVICQLLVRPPLYDEACFAFVTDDKAEPRTVSFYAGADKECIKDPQRFWQSPARTALLQSVLQGGKAPMAASAALVLPVRLEGRVAAVLALSHQPYFSEADDPDDLHALAEDIAHVLSRLRGTAPPSDLVERERRLRETVEQAGVGITRIDMDGHFVDVNQKFCDMLGYAREELVGRLTRDFTVPEDFGSGPVFRAQAQVGRATLLIGEKRYVRKDGTHLWVRRTMTAARDAGGRVREGISVIEDITQRKAAEEAARSERALLRTIIDAVPQYIYVKDGAGRFTLVNRAWLEARGLAPDEVHGKTVYDVFPAHVAAEMAMRDEVVLSGTGVRDVEQCVVVEGADGRSVRWSSTTKVPLHDHSGNVVGLVGISRDISESKRIEKELRDHVERFELAARATSDAIWDWDLSTDALWWGEGIEKLFGYRRSELDPDIGSWTSRIHPEDSDVVVTGIHAAIDEGARGWSADYRFRRLDGGWADVYDRAYIIRDEHGRAIRMIGAIMDITERKRAEEAIRRERALLRTIIDALPDYIHVKDAEGRLQLGNAAWQKARRLEGANFVGKTVHDIFPPRVAERMHEQDRRVILSGQRLLENDQPSFVFDDNGTPQQRWSASSKIPMRDEAGRVIGVVGISRDITQRRRMENERAMEHVVARVLAESHSVQSTMPRLIQTICEAIGWSYGAYWVAAPAGGLKRAGWWCDFEPEFEPADAIYWEELGTVYITGLLGKPWLERRPTWESDIEQMTQLRRAPSCRKLGFRSAYAFPISAQGETVGVMEFFGREVREPDEGLLEVTGAISDQIGQFIRRKQAEESLQESEQQLRAVFENADVGISMTSIGMRYLRVNEKYCKIVGYAAEEMLGMDPSEVNIEANLDAMREYRRCLLAREVNSITAEKQLVRKDGSLVWVSLVTSLVRGSDGSPRYFISVIQDISDNKRAAQALKESEEQFRVLAHYDLVTGLPNRALFYDRLAHALAHARRNRWWLAVMFVDVDRFKNVNDTFGHAAGDQLLKQVGERLSECVRSDDTVGRLSGDEFAIVLSRVTAPEDAATVAQKIVKTLNLPLQLEGTEIFVTASIGITVFPTDTVDQDTLIRNADVAMYRAKDRGRNNYQFYTPELNRRTREMLNMEGELRRAIERDELVLHFQSKVSLATGQVTGVEALLRWRHPERGLVSPAEFIPLLEETGLIVNAGEWVLRAVCRQFQEWQALGVEPVPIAVNLSARQFLSPNLGESIRSILEQSQIDPRLLEVEITESAIMSDTEEASRTLRYLGSLGVASAVDDFGTGYSSLAYLKRFPLRALKIDRSFIADITTDADDAHITQAVISMAHSLGLKVVAEGVETEAQLAQLLRYGCDEVQGFLFSRPGAAEERSPTDETRNLAIIDSVRAPAT